MFGVADDFSRPRSNDGIELLHLKGAEQRTRPARQDDGFAQGAATEHFDLQSEPTKLTSSRRPSATVTRAASR